MTTSPLVHLEVRNAKDSELTPEAMMGFIGNLASVVKTSWWKRLQGSQPTVSLEIAALNQTVFFVVTVDREHVELIKSQVVSQYQTAIVSLSEDFLAPWSRHAKQSVGQLVFSAPFYYPLKTYNKFQTTDPLSAILGVLTRTPPRTALIAQIIISGAPKGWSNPVRSMLRKGVSTDPEKFEAHPHKAIIEEKIAASAFRAGIKIMAIADEKEDADSLLYQLAGTFAGYSLNEGNSFKLVRPSNPGAFIESMVKRSAAFIPRKQYLTTLELASLYHFPSKEQIGLKNIAWGKSMRGEPPDNLPVVDSTMDASSQGQITVFAKTEFKNQIVRFGIHLPDRRRHVYILGKSGTGKSYLLSNMAISDINNGFGVCFIDPHGDAIDHILDFIPENRIKDVCFLDPSDLAHPFHINPLEYTNPDQKELIVSGIVAIFQKLFFYSWGPRLEYILRLTLMTLIEIPGATFLDIPRILTDKKYTEWVVTQLDPLHHSVLIEFWSKEFASYNDKLKSEAVAPILNKVGQFISSPTIRTILRHPKSTIDLEQLMNEGRIVLLNLSHGKIGEDNAMLLGAMFITKFQLAAMNRAAIPEEQRRDFFLYVDEFQNFATTSFIKILSEARKYRLGLVLANQYTAQLPEEIQKAIFGNVGTIASFVVGADDATRIMNEFGNLYTQEDLVNLDRYQIITKISIDNRISSPFPAYTLPLPENTTINRQAAIESSQNIYNLTAEQSIQQIKDLKPVGPPPPPMIDPNQPPPPVDIGKTYQGRVANVMNYGVFVEVVPGRQGLLHTSKMTKEFLKTFSTLKAGDTIPVTVFQVDDQNRVNLSMKDEGKAIVPPGTTSKPIIPFRQTPRPIKPSESRLTRPFKDLPKAVMPDLIRHLPSETVPPGTASLPAGMVTRKADRSSWDVAPPAAGDSSQVERHQTPPLSNPSVKKAFVLLLSLVSSKTNKSSWVIKRSMTCGSCPNRGSKSVALFPKPLPASSAPKLARRYPPLNLFQSSARIGSSFPPRSTHLTLKVSTTILSS
ncbi:hypothetical protein A2368_03245 [Candidatus Collierbacteria bacterium RIFOXYB1_FULL_49_13]|uniref:S1 motif domain-containing protein n=1 Tax=Candidatus Collierbacteria bacterium RIFOXYB1_FULL_49_13 TaxID=1817728 RepID=A0A1F5FH13_9BACT|nr:MAG: hypothetical protein A2368_03245 [Candidatus Collierbacteria bacterium RIFOXYB1_FULL_49_13]